MKIIILAGGLGTRLQSITKNIIPKPMVLVNNKPFLEFVLDYLLSQGFTEVILAVSHLHQNITNYFNNSYKTLKITYSIENTPLGTGGAIVQALDKIHNEENVFIINGDTFCKINYKEFLQYHTVNNSNFSIVIKKYDNITRYGIVKITSRNKVVDFNNNKTTSHGYINCGVYLLKKKFFNDLTNIHFPKYFSFECDFLYPFVKKLDILAYKCKNFFVDIGIPEDYNAFNKLLCSSQNEI